MNLRFSGLARVGFVVLMIALLSACGGGGGGDDQSGSSQPENRDDDRVLVADAGRDRELITGARVTLDGSESRVASNRTIEYAWRLISRPAASNASLSRADTATPAFTADADGDYVVALIVSDGLVESDADRVTITATMQNTRPSSEAGKAQSVSTGERVTLDGGASNDADGDRLAYRWQFVSRPAGSNANLTGATSVNASFVADLAGAFVLSLTVNDGTQDSEADRVTVTAAQGNSAPVANAGPDQTVAVNRAATLDGSNSSDADGDMLAYSWRIIARPQGGSASLANPNTASPSLNGAKVGDYVIQLEVSDGQFSATDNVVVSVGPVLVFSVDEGDPTDASPDYAVSDSTIVLVNLENNEVPENAGSLESLRFGRIRLEAIGQSYTIDDLQLTVKRNSTNRGDPALSATGLASGDLIVEGGQADLSFLASDIAVPGEYRFDVDFKVRETDVAYSLRYRVSLESPD